ncbi:GntR family transcriptional regulator [Burkholderia anthina]|uniref:GntR family transcriptional regulator n=1 Tax=Burkholderia anthina TaxID=179879 RepID=UPI0037BF8C74
MNFNVKENRSIAGQIATSLAERIISGDIAPGERLRQDELAIQFEASHVPVREAFRRLEAQGLVVSEPRRGVRVAPLDPLAVREVAKMRAALETLALRESMPALADAGFADLDRLLEDESSERSVLQLEVLNRRLHRALVEHCAMPRLLTAIDDLHRASTRHLFAAWKRLDWQSQSHDGHKQIVEALRVRDVEAACAALSSHIIGAGDALAAALER